MPKELAAKLPEHLQLHPEAERAHCYKYHAAGRHADDMLLTTASLVGLGDALRPHARHHGADRGEGGTSVSGSEMVLVES